MNSATIEELYFIDNNCTYKNDIREIGVLLLPKVKTFGALFFCLFKCNRDPVSGALHELSWLGKRLNSAWSKLGSSSV